MVTDYDNIGMPRGGGISDPTPKQAFRNKSILPERLVREYQNKIAFIDKSSSHLKREREINILHWKLSGMKTKHIAELEGITERHVRRIISEMPKECPKCLLFHRFTNLIVYCEGGRRGKGFLPWYLPKPKY